ncbi:MAG: dihydropteroate synthase [Sphingobacteriales bacterium JAD_PAG50586_3]|nr:MAG: dihydropteroate synthase [Sphingobacteriales bacterium JAD_PAG50586_3]
MGILNATPDSFYDGGQNNTIETAIQRAGQIIEEGGDIIDIGAASTRPGAEEISVEEELHRLIPIVKAVAAAYPDAILSVDTYRAVVAAEAIAAGAHIVNDIAGGTMDSDMFATVAKLGVPYILMHIQGTPQTMQHNPEYTDVTADVLLHLSKKVNELKLLGVTDIIVDPGFGFGKTIEQNYQLLNELDQLQLLGYPILAGLSRKGMIYKPLGLTAAEALPGTIAANKIALEKGASVLRVHDVKEAVELVMGYR